MGPELSTLLAATTPVGELRLAIPLAVYRYGLPWYQALGWSLVGNLLPVVVLLWALHRVGGFLQSFPNPVGRFLTWRAARLRAAHAGRFQRYGAMALVMFVALPLPFTGAWTGTLAAWAFDIPYRRALPVIALGVLIAGAIVSTLTVTGSFLWLLVVTPE